MRSYLTKFEQKLGCLSQTWEYSGYGDQKRLYPAQRSEHRLASRPIKSLNTTKLLTVFSFSFFPTLLNNDLSADFHRKLSENMYLNANKILYNDTSRLGWLILSWRLLTLTEDKIELANTTKRPKNSLQDQKKQTLTYSNMCLKSHLTL